MDHATIIERLGGCKTVADWLGEKPNTVSHWKGRRIPADRWPDVVEMARSKKIPGVTFDTLQRRTAKATFVAERADAA
jgi:hypothetical protein